MSFGFYLTAFIISIILVILFTPLAGLLAIRFSAIDSPSGRKIHRKEIPLWGGLAILASIFGTIFILPLININFSAFVGKDSFYASKLIEGIFAGAVMIVALGVIDDLKGMSATTKLLGQIIAAMIVMQYGIQIDGFKIPFSEIYLEFPLYLIMLVTVFWIVGFINSINLIDGIDGLATGVTAISTMVFFIISIHQLSIQTDPLIITRLKLASTMSLVVSGACIGFLKFNFPPAKIFLGDSGSLLLGYFAGVITITGILKTAGIFTLLVPLIIFGVPLLDTLFSLIRRIFQKKSPMEADRDHLHHQLFYSKGWTTKKVIIRIYTITFFLGVVAILTQVLQ